MDPIRASKFLSLVLRHDPSAAGMTLDAGGWAGVDALLAGANRASLPLDRPGLEAVVRASDKQRFALSDDGRRVRANQGHSVEVDLVPVAPPPVLYHGTVARFVEAVRREGLRPMRRRHVHLSADRATAESVGRRRGEPVVLTVDAAAMAGAGLAFYQSANGVWLADAVPPEYLA